MGATGDSSAPLRPVPQTLAWVLAYAVTLVAARYLVVDDGSGAPPVSLIAPSSGVALLWLATARSRREQVLDSLLLVVTADVVLVLTNVVLGLPRAPVAQLVLVVLAPLLYLLTLELMRRWTPHLWGAGGRAAIRTLRDLLLVLAAMAVGVLVYSVVRTLVGEVVIPAENLPLAVGRATRSFSALVTIGLTGLLIGGARAEAADGRRPAITALSTADLTMLVVIALAAVGVFFAAYELEPRAPLNFVFTVVVAWLALRFRPEITALGAFVVGAAVLALTIAGEGPLAQIDESEERAAIAQLLLVVLMVLGLVISLSRTEVLDSLATLERSEESVRRRAEELDLMMANLADPVAVIEDGGQVVHANQAMIRMMGPAYEGPGMRVLPPSQMPPEGLMVRSDGALLDDENSPLHRALAGEQVSNEEWRTRVVDGPYQWLSFTAAPLPPEAGGPARAMLVIRDVSEEKAHAEVLAQRAAELNLVIDNLLDGLAIVEEGGHYVQVNGALRRIMGWAIDVGTAGDTVGTPRDYHLRFPDGRPVEHSDYPYLRALEGITVSGEEWHLEHPDRGRQVLSLSAFPLPTRDDEPRRAMVVVRDVTLERSYQESLSTFARTVAHDLNNPLMVIEGWTDAIDDDLSGSSDPDVVRAAGQLRYVRNGVTQMREFVSDLLSHAMAADQSLQCTTLDLGEVVADIAAQRNAPGLPQGGIVVGELPSVWADPVLVRQVLDNLIGNAAKYVAPGVTPQIHVEARPSVDGWVEVAVRDNGIGIHPAQREQVFENFHRANQSGYAGTGLGLGICKRIVERHGGSIRVEGNPEGGSTFVFSLPVSSSALIASGGRSSAR